jgi:hypoxanthine-guanine phosphoribosyltransferase
MNSWSVTGSTTASATATCATSGPLHRTSTPDACSRACGPAPVDVRYVGWELCIFPANEFVVGYGLDYRERYRNLRDIGTLAPHVYS